jgi:hypothetical protein
VSESLRRHIECILCNPVQGDVMHEGVAANPDFGCAGADLDFNNEGISLSTLRNAVIGNEPRLTDVTVSRQDITVRERGDVSIRPGVCVEAQWAATGEAIPRIELIVQDLARIRAANQMRRRVDAAKGSGT